MGALKCLGITPRTLWRPFFGILLLLCNANGPNEDASDDNY